MVSRSVNNAQGKDLYIRWLIDINFKVVFPRLKFETDHLNVPFERR